MTAPISVFDLMGRENLDTATQIAQSQNYEQQPLSVFDLMGDRSRLNADTDAIGKQYAQALDEQALKYPKEATQQLFPMVQKYRADMDNHFARLGYSDEQRGQILASFDANSAFLNPTDGTLTSYVTDPVKTLGKGFMNLAGSVTGAFAPDAEITKAFKDAAKAYDLSRSADSQVKALKIDQAINDDIANGSNEAWATFKHLVTNPSQIGNLALENLPQMMFAPAGAAAMGAVGAAQVVGNYRDAVMNAWRELTPEQAMAKPEIQGRIAKGMTLEQAIEDVSTDISDHLGGIARSAAIGSLESLSPLAKVGKVAGAVNRGAAKTFAKEVGKEFAQEGLEQASENYGVGYIDGKTQLMDGVQRAAVTGALASAPFGGVAGYDAYRNDQAAQAQSSQLELSTDEQEIQQAGGGESDNEQVTEVMSPMAERQFAQLQPQQAIQNPQQNANLAFDETAFNKAIESVAEDNRDIFKARLERDIANGNLANRTGSGKYDRFVRDYLALNQVPEVVRQAEQQTTQGEVAPEILQPNTVIQGGQAQIQLGSQGSQTAQYELVEADELTVNLKPNAYQDRDRTSVESQAQIMDYANNLNPSYLGASVDVTQGAPTVDEQYGVFAGNGRLSAIKQAYAKNPEKATAYRDYLAQNAGQFGLTAEQVAGMKQPVLVRKMTSPIDVRKAVKEGNFNTGLDKGVLGNAKDNAQYITDDLLDLALINEDGSLNLSSSNDDFIQGLVANIPVEIRPKFFAERKMGNHSAYTLTAQGRELVENALLVRAYSDGTSYAENLLTDLITDISDSNKRVKTALISVAGKVIQTKGTDYDIAPSIIQAYDLMTKGKKAGLDVQEAINQGDMLNPPSEFVKGLVERFYSPKSVVEVQQPLNEYLNKVINSNLNNTQQDNMFGDDFNPSREELLRESGMRASLARNNATVDSDIEQARTIIEQRLGKEYADRIEFKRSSDFSANDGRSQSEGFFENDKVHLIVDNIQNTPVMNRAERMAWVAWHEFAHNGVALKYGTQYDRVMLYARSNAFIRRLTKIKQAEYRNEGVILTENLATEESLVELYAAIKTGNWDEIADRYGVHVSQEWKTGEKKTGLEKIIDVVARSLRLIASRITGKDLRKASIDDVLGMLKQIDNVVNSLAENSENQTASSNTRYSLNERSDSEFAKAVDDVANGNRTALPIIDVGTTPDVLKMLGLPDVNVVISGAVLHKVMHGKHNVTPETLKQLPKQINDPVAVMRSETQSNGYVVLTELTERENGKDKPVISALHLKQDRNGLELINIASVYGRSNAQIQRGLENDLLYWNKEKGAKFLDNLTLQLRSPLSSNSPIGGDIKTEADLSQYRDENSSAKYSLKRQNLTKSEYEKAKADGKTELTFQQWKQVRSPEFKRWFGDWENDPENASKVINPRTGEPLVVYHFTDNDFFTFNKDFSGKNGLYYGDGFYFTNEEGYSNKYGKRKISAFLNLRNPLPNDPDKGLKKIARKMGVRVRGYDFYRRGFAEPILIKYLGGQGEFAKELTEAAKLLKFDGILSRETFELSEIFTVFNPNQIKSATDNNGEFSAENEDIRYSRKQSAMETANAKQVNQHPNAFERVKNGGFAQFKKEVEKARAFIDTKMHDRLRPVMDWIEGIEVQGLSAYEKSQLKDSIYAAEGIKADIIVQAEQKYLNPIRDDIAAIAKKYFNGDGETALKKAGFWISTRWAIEKNAQMLKADYDAMIEAEQEYNDSVANGEPMDVQDRLERAFIKAENQYYNRKADVESRDFSDDRKYKVGTAGGWSTPLAKAIMAKMESQIPRAELEALAEKVYDLNAWKLDQDLESGRFTAEEVKRFKQDRHYVPLTGDPSMELDDVLRMPSNRNPNVAKDKGLQGRKLSEADDAISTIWESVAKTATYNGWQPMKAHFAKLYDQAYQEAISNGLSKKAAADEATNKTGISKQKMQGLTRTSDNVLIYKENGNYYELSLPEKAMEQIKKQNSDNTPALLRPVQAATGWLARGVTQFKPHFAIVNMVRDLWEKSEFVRTKEIFDKNGNPLPEEVKNQIGREMWKQAMGAIAGQNRDVWKAAKRYAMKQGLRDNVPAERELKILLKNGGVSTHSTLLERKETDLIKTINRRNNTLAKGIEKAILAVEIYNGIFDIISSIAANRALLKYGVDPKHASAVTLDLTNFRKQGDWMPFIKSFYMFAQPTAVGGANLIKMMGTKTGRKRLLQGALFYGTLSFILRSIADEDEDGNAFAKEGDKDRFIPISIGGYNFKLPVGYGAPQLMWNMGYNITEAIMGDKTWGDAAASTMLHAFKAVAPVSPSEVPVSEYPGTKALMTLTPTIAQPIVQNIVNRNAFGSSLASSFINDKSLKAEQGKMNTAPEWTEAALWLNDTFGMDFAPEHVKNFVQGYANMVPLMNEALTILVENPNKARLGKPESVPFINALIGPKNPYATQSQFYRFRDEANDTVLNFNSRKKRDTLPESWKTDPEIRWQRNWFAKVEEMEKTQRKVKSNLTKLHNDGKLSTEAYQHRLNNLAKDTEAKQRKLVGMWRFHNGLNTSKPLN